MRLEDIISKSYRSRVIEMVRNLTKILKRCYPSTGELYGLGFVILSSGVPPLLRICLPVFILWWEFEVIGARGSFGYQTESTECMLNMLWFTSSSSLPPHWASSERSSSLVSAGSRLLRRLSSSFLFASLWKGSFSAWKRVEEKDNLQILLKSSQVTELTLHFYLMVVNVRGHI